MSTDKPRISIIVPTYNRAAFIEEAITSVLEQTESDWELLIVDDGSTDDTRSILEPFLSDTRIHYQYQQNQGQPAAQNKALESARGEFICFLDSDNAWLPRKLEVQLVAMKNNPDVDIIYGDNIKIDEHGNEIGRTSMRRYSGNIASHLLKDNCVSVNTTMTRRHCFDEMGGMNTERPVAADYDIWLRFSTKYRFLFIPEFFGRYRIMADQISSDKRKRYDTNEKTIHDFLEQYPSAVTSQEAKNGLSVFYSRKAKYYAKRGDRQTAFQAIYRALSYAPSSKIVWRSVFRVIFPSRRG